MASHAWTSRSPPDLSVEGRLDLSEPGAWHEGAQQPRKVAAGDADLSQEFLTAAQTPDLICGHGTILTRRARPGSSRASRGATWRSASCAPPGGTSLGAARRLHTRRP